MPTVSSSFDLKPVNFFDKNPILRAAPYFEEDLPVCETFARGELPKCNSIWWYLSHFKLVKWNVRTKSLHTKCGYKCSDYYPQIVVE